MNRNKAINVVHQALQDYVENSLSGYDHLVEVTMLNQAWQVLLEEMETVRQERLAEMVDTPQR